MEITLSTAFNPGDLDSGKQYNKARIVSVSVDPLILQATIVVELGSYEDGVWRRGGVKKKVLTLSETSNPTFATMMSAPSLESEPFDPHLARMVFSAVQTAWPELAGTVG